MTTYFITGMSGFLGTNLVQAILTKGDALIHGLVLKDDPAFGRYEKEERVILHKGDLRDKESLAAFLKDADSGSVLIHAAARIALYSKNDPLTVEVNKVGTQNLIEEALRHPLRRFIYVSSVDALLQAKGDKVTEPDDYDESLCYGVYGKSKAAASALVLKACREHGLPLIIVNPSAILGPNDPFLSPMNEVLMRFAQGKIPAYTAGGYDIVDVRDVANGILAAIEKGRVGESYLLTGTRHSVKEMFEAFGKVIGRKAPRLGVPFFVLAPIAPIAEHNAKKKMKRPMLSPLAITCLKLNPFYCADKAKKELGYAPRGFEETIRDAYASLFDYGYLP